MNDSLPPSPDEQTPGHEHEHGHQEGQTDQPDELNPEDHDGPGDRLIGRMREALEGDHDREQLHEVGDLLFEEFSGPEYSAEVVLTSLADVYREHRDQFDPKLTFVAFIRSFGSGLVKLCQQKLVDEGGYDLGQYGEKGDGIDGILGRMTNRALREYFRNLHGGLQDKDREQAQQPAEDDRPTDDRPAEDHPEQARGEVDHPETETPARPSEKPRLSPKALLEGAILDHYHRTNNSYRTVDLPKIFGRDRKTIEKHITDTDPVTGGDLTFLGRPLFRPDEKGVRGTHLYLIPFLKIAEEKIRNSGINYQPRARSLGGYRFRGMKIGGKETKTLSSHAFGLAIDIDPGFNGPKHGRGDIPDQVVMAMVESGFAWGYIREPVDYPKLGIDPMHFQLRFPPDSPEGQAIINSSPTGQKYWRAVQEKMSQII